MKIVQLCYLFNPAIGGVESHVMNLSKRLVSKGHEVHVICSDFADLSFMKKIPEKYQIVDKIQIFRLPSKKISFKYPPNAQWIKMEDIKNTLERIKPDIIHVHSFPSSHFFAAVEYSKTHRVKLFLTGHYSPDDLRAVRGNMKSWIYWRYFVLPKLLHFLKYIAIINSEKEVVHSCLMVPEKKISILPNGVNTKEFDDVKEEDVERFRKVVELTHDKVILFAGRIATSKGIDSLIRAFSMLGMNKLSLVIAGPPVEKAYYDGLKKIVDDLGLSEKVRFVEPDRLELIKYFKMCELLVLPSKGEVFGIVLAEGMYCRKIVIGSDKGGIPEIIDDGVAGFLYREGDDNDLKEKMANALGLDESKRSEITQKAMQKVKDMFDWDNIADKILMLYNER